MSGRRLTASDCSKELTCQTAEVHAEGSRFRRRTQKTPQQVSTLFGTITLRRMGYRAGPADGEPVLRPAKGAPELMRVINCTALILQDPASSTFYLRALAGWWMTKSLTGDWTAADPLPTAGFWVPSISLVLSPVLNIGAASWQ